MGRIVRIMGAEYFLMPQGFYSIIPEVKNDEDFLMAYSNSPEYRKIITTEKMNLLKYIFVMVCF